ncbi:EAL domain-containing protein [Rossellomorea aquimaris]|uniref:EAL domain-containing protein n=1 Tax=Rossellomorea aquimaris TaxID=189382 RepID=UPI001CD392E1|nr:EAL domain-containing protein [Rossellomorea aquimaris]MCA1056675.1 EAL domain-containing protein [Rossellomorea aquimaris]
MNSFCPNCGITMDFHDAGNLYLYNQHSDRLPFEGFTPFGTHSFVMPYDNLEKLSRELQPYSEKLNDEGWTCSISPSERPGDYYSVKEFINRVKHRDMIGIIQKGEFVSYLQPIISLQDDRLYGYESLLRSADSSVSFHPGELFHAASVTGFQSMLDQRARKAAIESRIGNIEPGVKSFINFLPSTIYNPEFCLKHTFQIVDKYDVNPEDLVFEVVETEKIDDINHLKGVLDVYKREGMKVALDDVGAGFATIEMLSLLQPDYVKIDRSYISGCDGDVEKQSFLKQVCATAQDLGIAVLAEGVERKEELSLCKEIGVKFAQGYLIGKPDIRAKSPLKQLFV